VGNYFDPALGYVPAGFGNSAGPTVVLSSSGAGNFAWLQGGGTVEDPGIDSWLAEFNGSVLTVTFRNLNYPEWHYISGSTLTFKSSVFVGLSIIRVDADDFLKSNNGAMSATLVGDTITLSVAPQCGSCNWPPDTYSNTYQLLPALAGQTTRVSIDSTGAQADAQSWYNSISADGRYVAFESGATNLVAGDANGALDVFVHDRATGMTTRVSVSSDGAEGNGLSAAPSISADGRYVAFHSLASNLVIDDTNGAYDAFVHDRVTGETTRVSVGSSGTEGNLASVWPAISGDGRYVAIHTYASNLVVGDANGTYDIVVHDRVSGSTTLASVNSYGEQANSGSDEPAFSGDSRYVAFESMSSNLVSGYSFWHVYVHDRLTGATEAVSKDSAGIPANDISRYPSISSDGQVVAFMSYASNLVLGDTNGERDIFVHDRATGVTTRVSVDSAGGQGNGFSYGPSVSADGRYVAFFSAASNLVAGDTNGVTDAFVHDRVTGKTTRVSVDATGLEGNGACEYPSISADGTYVSFASYASNLVVGDTNGVRDVFVHQMPVADITPPTVVMNIAGTLGNDGWYVSDVHVSWTFNDPESAISETTGCDATSVTTDTAGTTFTCSATSLGGTTTESVTIKRDTTPPAATATAVPPATADGWRKQTVTVTFTGTDAMSGGVTCDGQVILSSEGVDQSASGRCYDWAGNQSDLATASGINIDKTNPTVTIISPVNGAAYHIGELVLASYGCDDSLSGIASCVGTVPNGYPIDTSKKVKNRKFTVKGTDKANNSMTASVTYSVIE